MIEQQNNRHGKQSQRNAADGEPRKTRAFPKPGIARLVQFFFTWLTEKNYPVEFNHHITRQRRRQHQRSRTQWYQHVEIRVGQARRKQKCLQQQPLRNKAVQRRQPGNRQRTDERQPRHPRHIAYQPSEFTEAALMRGVQHRACAQKQQAFEKCVIQTMIERGHQRQRRQMRIVVRMKNNREAHASENNADVFNGRIRQQALHVALHGSEHHAKQRCHQAQHQRHHAPPPDLRGQQVKRHAQQAVDRRLQHHPAHQRRNGRRRCGMRFRQPHMQRQQPGFCAKAKQRQQKCSARPKLWQRVGAHVVKCVLSVGTTHHAKT